MAGPAVAESLKEEMAAACTPLGKRQVTDPTSSSRKLKTSRPLPLSVERLPATSSAEGSPRPLSDFLSYLIPKLLAERRELDAAREGGKKDDNITRRGLIRFGKCTLTDGQWASVIAVASREHPRLVAVASTERKSNSTGKRRVLRPVKRKCVLSVTNKDEELTLLGLLYGDSLLPVIQVLQAQHGWGRNAELIILAIVLTLHWDRAVPGIEVSLAEAMNCFQRKENQGLVPTHDFQMKNEGRSWPPAFPLHEVHNITCAARVGIRQEAVAAQGALVPDPTEVKEDLSDLTRHCDAPFLEQDAEAPSRQAPTFGNDRCFHRLESMHCKDGGHTKDGSCPTGRDPVFLKPLLARGPPSSQHPQRYHHGCPIFASKPSDETTTKSQEELADGVFGVGACMDLCYQENSAHFHPKTRQGVHLGFHTASAPIALGSPDNSWYEYCPLMPYMDTWGDDPLWSPGILDWVCDPDMQNFARFMNTDRTYR